MLKFINIVVFPACVQLKKFVSGDSRGSGKETHRFHGVGERLLLTICALLNMQALPKSCAVRVLLSGQE